MKQEDQTEVVKQNNPLKVCAPQQTEQKIISITDNYRRECLDTERKEPLTIESLRNCKGYENLTNEEATDIVNSFKTLVTIMVETHLKNNIIIDNQQVVYLDRQKQQAA
jgi:hypothetical protein